MALGGPPEVLDGFGVARAGRRGRGWLVRRVLLLADVSALAFAFALTELLFHRPAAVEDVGPLLELAIFVALLPVWVVAAKVYGLYDRDEERTDHSTVDEFVSVFHLITVGVWLFFALSWLGGFREPGQAKLAVFWALAIAAVTAARSAARAVARHRPEYRQNVLIVGAGEVGQLIGRKLLQHPEYGLEVLGFVDSEPRKLRAEVESLPVLRGLDELPALTKGRRVDRVVVAFSRDSHEQLLPLIRVLRGTGVRIDLVPRLFQAIGMAVVVHSVEGLPLVGLTPSRLSRSSRLLKRTIDVSLASLCLLVTAPLFAYIAWRIKRDSPGPVFFRQTRLGEEMHEFTMLKFRSMKVDTDEAPHREYIEQILDSRAEPGENNLYKLERRADVTRVGKWLRRTSLDELPQLINVVKGDISLVGPRPCLPYETEHFEPHHFERFFVPAGITGLWQVSARAHSTFGEALDLDVSYARSWSLGLDFRLLFKTPRELLRMSGTA